MKYYAIINGRACWITDNRALYQAQKFVHERYRLASEAVRKETQRRSVPMPNGAKPGTEIYRQHKARRA